MSKEISTVLFRAKRSSLLMRTIGAVAPKFMTHYWTTFWGVIYYPTSVRRPMASEHRYIAQHELVHLHQQRDLGGKILTILLYLIFPLPIFFSGRWFVERDAFLLDIKNGYRTVAESVDELHFNYIRPWPRSWMAKWFRERL